MLLFEDLVFEGLFDFEENMILQDQNIHLSRHEASVSIFRSTDNRLAANIETSVNNNSRPCLLLKFLDQSIIATISGL